MRFFLLLISAVALAACGNDRDKIVMGTPWKYDVEATRELLTENPVSEAQFNFMEGVMNRLKDATVEFKEDNLLLINIGDDQTTGYWAIKGDLILMQVTKVSSAPYKILEMTPQRIVLRPDSNDEFNFTRVLVPAK